MAQLAKVDLLILVDFGMKAMSQEARTDLHEVFEGRTKGPTLMTSQVPVEKWHDYLSEGNPTIADALLDRLVSGAIRVKLRGESMRKVRAQQELGQREDEANLTHAKNG